MTLQNPEKYCLKRFDLLLNPTSNPEDSAIYAGRDDLRTQLEKRVNRAILVNQKLHTILWGPYGGGKTHTLYYIKHYLESNPVGQRKPEVFVLVCPAFVKNTFVELYSAIIRELGKKFILELLRNCYEILEPNLKKKPDEERIQIIHEKIGNRDVAYAMLTIMRPQSDEYLVWKWFSGEACSSGEKKTLGVLKDNSKSEDAISTLESIVRMYEIANEGKKLLVLMIDELENLTALKGTAQDFIHGFRKMVDQTTLAIFGAATAGSVDSLPVLRNPAVKQRIGFPHNFIEIQPFTPEGAKKFVSALLKQIRPANTDLAKRIEECKRKKLTSETLSKEFFPFTEELIEEIINGIQADGEPLIPRNIEMKLTDVIGDALARTSPPEVFDTSILR